MPAMARDAVGARGRGRSAISAVFRGIAWAALLGATGVLVRAEVVRPVLPRGVTAYSDLVYRPDGDRSARIDLYVPATPAPAAGRPAILAIHGGGWRGGSKRGYGRMASVLAEHGYVVAAVDYTLSSPSTPSWPANLEDLREAVRWLRRHASAYEIDPDRIAALGASAGGHLAALLATAPEGALAVPPRGSTAAITALRVADHSSRVQAVIDFYGPSDLEALGVESPRALTSLSLYLGGTPAELPERYAAASPVSHVTPDSPPMLLIHGDADLLVPPEQSRRLARALADAHVPHRLIVLPGVRHGFEFQAGSRNLVPEILAFLESAWNVTSDASSQ